MNAQQHLVMAILKRDGYRCVRCGKPAEGERGYHWSLHHRQARGMGGAKHRPSAHTAANLITVCGSGTTGCHHFIEVNRAEARDKGWLVWRTSDPESVAVLVEQQSRWVYLTADGRVVDAPPERAA